MTLKAAKRLVEPDYWTCPHGNRARPVEALTYGPEVAEVNAKAGFEPDAQQELGLDLIFAIRPDGAPATFEFCVICARQNLKTGLFLQAAIGWLFVLDVPEIAWSAHELSTAKDAQRDLAGIIRNSSTLSKRMKPGRNEGIYDANGEERIELANGQTVWFKARTRDGGRGLAKPKLVLDEAFALKAAMLGAIIPILLAQYQPQVLYGSSPGKVDSVELRDLRERGRAHLSPMMTYLEWGGKPLPDCLDADGQPAPDCMHPKTGLEVGAPCVMNRIEIIVARNPATATERMPIENLANVRQTMPTAEWIRECMAVWEDPTAANSDIIFPGWGDGIGEPLELPEEPAAIGVAIALDRSWASIAAASPVEVLEDPTDEESEPVERSYVAPVNRRQDWSKRVKIMVDGEELETSWLVAEVKRIQDETDCAVVMDAKGPGKDLAKDFEEADVAVELIDLDGYAEATARWSDKVRNGRLLHPEASELDDAVTAAAWRFVGNLRLPGLKQSSGHIDMLEAAILADHGADKFGTITLG